MCNIYSRFFISLYMFWVELLRVKCSELLGGALDQYVSYVVIYMQDVQNLIMLFSLSVLNSTASGASGLTTWVFEGPRLDQSISVVIYKTNILWLTWLRIEHDGIKSCQGLPTPEVLFCK